MPQSGHEAVALLSRKLLAKLDAAASRGDATPLSPAHEAPAEGERLPRAAGRRERGVGRAVALPIRQRLHAAADADPELGVRYFADLTVNLKVVPSRVLDATQMRPPKERSTTSRQR